MNIFRPSCTLLILLALYILLKLARCEKAKLNIREKEKQVLEQILDPRRYDARIRPFDINGTGEAPTFVRVKVFIQSISKIDDKNMEFSVHLTLTEQWLDGRLNFKNLGGGLKYLTLTEVNRVWMPDLFFSNEKEVHSHNVIMPNKYIRIFPNGNVLYSTQIYMTLDCVMNLKLFPLDKQTCDLKMGSYGWTTDDLVFLWEEGDPVQVAESVYISPPFTLKKFVTDYCNSSMTNTGKYSFLKVGLLFKREFAYYLIQIFLKCCVLLIVPWVSFWLAPDAVHTRLMLGALPLFEMARLYSGINTSLHPVPYMKVIDVWLFFNISLSFTTILVSVIVNYAFRSDMHRKNMENP